MSLMENGLCELDFAKSLELATRFRLTSLLLDVPGEHTFSEARDLLPSLPSSTAKSVTMLVEEMVQGYKGLEESYHKILGAGGVVSPFEADYEPSCLCNNGPLLADIGGFYKAFGFELTKLCSGNRLDHVAVESAFLAYLYLKFAYAVFSEMPQFAKITFDAITLFRRDHFDPFLERFLVRLASDVHGHETYKQVADVVHGLVFKNDANTR